MGLRGVCVTAFANLLGNYLTRVRIFVFVIINALILFGSLSYQLQQLYMPAIKFNLNTHSHSIRGVFLLVDQSILNGCQLIVAVAVATGKLLPQSN